MFLSPCSYLVAAAATVPLLDFTPLPQVELSSSATVFSINPSSAVLIDNKELNSYILSFDTPSIRSGGSLLPDSLSHRNSARVARAFQPKTIRTQLFYWLTNDEQTGILYGCNQKGNNQPQVQVSIPRPPPPQKIVQSYWLSEKAFVWVVTTDKMAGAQIVQDGPRFELHLGHRDQQRRAVIDWPSSFVLRTKLVPFRNGFVALVSSPQTGTEYFFFDASDGLHLQPKLIQDLVPGPGSTYDMSTWYSLPPVMEVHEGSLYVQRIDTSPNKKPRSIMYRWSGEGPLIKVFERPTFGRSAFHKMHPFDAPSRGHHAHNDWLQRVRSYYGRGHTIDQLVYHQPSHPEQLLLTVGPHKYLELFPFNHGVFVLAQGLEKSASTSGWLFRVHDDRLKKPLLTPWKREGVHSLFSVHHGLLFSTSSPPRWMLYRDDKGRDFALPKLDGWNIRSLHEIPSSHETPDQRYIALVSRHEDPDVPFAALLSFTP